MQRLSLPTAVSWAQVVSAFVMVFTLLYAVSEWVRIHDTTSQDYEYTLYDRLLQMDVLIAESDELADIILRSNSDPQSLTPAERARFLAYENIFYQTWNALYDASEAGLISAGQYRLWEQSFITETAHRPKFGWTENLRHFNPPFIQYMESRGNWQ